MKRKFKWVTAILLLTAMITSGCGQKIEGTAEEVEAKKNFAASTPENDTDVGLKNIKIDTAEMTLTDEQKMIIQYFDNDYLAVPDYEFLRRYPNVFEGAQLNLEGTVKKVISADDESYSLVLWIGKTEDQFYYRGDNMGVYYEDYLAENEGNYVIINGTPSEAWFMEKDYLEVFGRYNGIETVEVDGISHTVPTIDVQKAFIASKDGLVNVEKFDVPFIKTIAKAIFGDDIELRQPSAGEDYVEEYEWRVLDEKPFYIVELENQSNAKFTKYRFYTQTGFVEDAKTGEDEWLLGVDYNIQRNLEFSADFEHFFLFTYDMALESLTLEYYDSDLNKQWKREFEETTRAYYDYTKNNIYLIANNELYIINTETGEDTFAPSYVGPKQAIRKLNDGILMISESKSDGVMKCGLDGSIIWKTNLSDDVYSVDGVQLVKDNIVFQQYGADSGRHYVVLDNADGTITIDAVPMG